MNKKTITKESFKELLGVNLELECILTERNISIDEIQKLKQGYVIDLNIPAGSNAILKINNINVAFGELLSIDEKFAFRISKIFNSNDVLEKY